uniref:Uncharacterized protein n=1 Tax=Rhizophora mucronata TaxID=61149 RepID=A0A2P2P664_RHIMU
MSILCFLLILTCSACKHLFFSIFVCT